MSKVTMQDIAALSGTSRVTVWKVLNKQGGVSEIVTNRVLAAATQLGYGTGKITLSVPPFEDEKTVSLIVSRPDSSMFWSNIMMQGAKPLPVTSYIFAKNTF